MASMISNGFFHPFAVLGLQCTASTIALGFQHSSCSRRRLLSCAMTPVQIGCAVAILLKARESVRPPWAAWSTGASMAILLRCLGEHFLRRTKVPSSGPRRSGGSEQSKSIWIWFLGSLSRVTDFRHLHSADEAKNTPHFSSTDPSYTPSRRRFLLATLVDMILCYLAIDFLTSAPLPPTALQDFAPEKMHLFSRASSVTLPELGQRFIMPIIAFTMGALVLKLAHDILALAAVGTGISQPKDWRPQFGPIQKAFTLRKFWGRVWHQNLRITFTTWSEYIVHDILSLPPSTTNQLTHYTKLIVVFAISGLLHFAIDVGSGVPAVKTKALVFFLFQPVGIMLEDGVHALYRRLTSPTGPETNGTKWWERVVGYCWVWSFLAWSVPWWIYPPMFHCTLQGQSLRILPSFSLVRWARTY